MQHLFKKGDVVTIFQLGFTTGLFVEGDAVVVKPVGHAGNEHYMVRFYSKKNGKLERETYERFIDREGQENPVQYIKEFNHRIGLANDG